MNILAIDTTSNVATAAIVEDTKLIAQYTLNHKKTHSQRIMGMIDEVLKSSQLDSSCIDAFAVSNGPGSFTGVRIGVAAIKAMAHVHKKPVVCVNSLEGLAYNTSYTNALICPIMDARRNTVYNAVYKYSGDVLECITQPRAIDIDECLAELAKTGQDVIFIGDGIFVYADKITAFGSRGHIGVTGANMHQAAAVAQCAYIKINAGMVDTYQSALPFYMKKSQAEQEYEEKEKQNDSNR